MKKLLTSLMLTTLLSLTAGSALAAEAPLKIGVIDLQKIMQKSSQVIAIGNQLEKRFKPKQQSILAARKALQEEAEKSNRNSATMSDVDRTKLQNKIIADKANLQSSEISYQQEVNAAQTQEMQKFMKHLQEVLNQVAKNGNYTLIMVKQGIGIPYVDQRLDITDTVLASLENKK